MNNWNISVIDQTQTAQHFNNKNKNIIFECILAWYKISKFCFFVILKYATHEL